MVIPEYRNRYDESKMPLPSNYLPLHPFHDGWMSGRDEQLAAWPRSEAEIRKHLTDYYGVITYLDEQIGRILQALEETGESANTVIIFSSDHGLAIGSHGLMGKQNLYEDAMKPPLIFAGPGIRQGRSTRSSTCTIFFRPSAISSASINRGKSTAAVSRRCSADAPTRPATPSSWPLCRCSGPFAGGSGS